MKKEKIFSLRLIWLMIFIFISSWLLLGLTIYIYTIIATNKNIFSSFPEILNHLTNLQYDNRIIAFIYCITVISASTFSFLLYKATVRSIEISEENKKLQEESMKLTQAMAEREIKKEDKEIKTNAFIILNDLKICFDFIRETLITYANENSKITIEKNNRDEWINSWKPILRKITFTNDWRELLKSLATESNVNYIEEIYKVCIFLESYNATIESSVDLHKKIELLPKESIFTNDFVNRYNNLRYSVSSYDEMQNTKNKLEESLSTVTECEIMSKGTSMESRKSREYTDIKNKINELQSELENQKENIYSQVNYFKELEEKNQKILNEKFIKILNNLNEIHRGQDVIGKKL